MLKQHEKSFQTFQVLLDVIITLACWALAYWIRFSYLKGGQGGLAPFFTNLTLLVVPATIYFFYKNNLYRSQRFHSRFYEIFAVVKANSSAFLAIILFLYFFSPSRVSRIHLLIYLAISTFMLTLVRIMVRNFLRHLRRKGQNLRHMLLIGNGEQLTRYIHNARKFKDSGIRFCGWIDSEGKAQEFKIEEITSDYNSIKEQIKPDGIIISYGGVDSHKSLTFLKEHYNDITPIQLLPDLSYSFVGHQIEDFDGVPLLAVNQPNFSTLELFFKRLFDLVTTFVGLVIISPLLTLIALGVKISSPGPIFYGQERIGLDGKKFKMWKFRSMKVADDDSDTKEWSNKENPRKTKFGSFLRKTSLDELPQLWNVLVGEMSLVGPRPEQPFFVDKFREEIPGYMLRHKMKAGITGWAQINGWRGDTSLYKRIECDIYYIKHWNFWFDIKIFFLTFWKGFINSNAY